MLKVVANSYLNANFDILLATKVFGIHIAKKKNLGNSSSLLMNFPISPSYEQIHYLVSYPPIRYNKCSVCSYIKTNDYLVIIFIPVILIKRFHHKLLLWVSHNRY
ncbi:hypothetical protein BD770DRAFT_451221 [Pilaira anomala]|nr:hypothetical protein BD770DRAFT_451221 [Pilaira anomala]